MSIDPRELRIGNFVLNPHTKEMHQVSILDINDIDLKYKTRDAVALTPELLLKCGFTKGLYGEREQWLSQKIERVQPTTYYQLGIIMSAFGFYSYEDSVCLVRLDYLHQLQNIFWCLVGKELNVNL